ncbi:hypothetical protein M406DRAFT_248006 [Cryphonectria parasitica EP155]|uniref:Gfd2/YDR514C-like C-terminal domain-containing protein n=1 Tax=Cryphonectria parasitica (strain ATCC 38755 / EP155) TaxID=660469 RepID=A0A9P4YBH7_CRYP1|nr:uncharacterized protein M406DRAFT_248006 [Cryphonectria parasitica EP155]KAF3770006.1 hypothetical protein M406DRAFT_248006 [Cryphonectria parasitica EP155]
MFVRNAVDADGFKINTQPGQKSTAEVAKLDAQDFKDLGLKVGEQSGAKDAFVPWKFLLRYGELYVGKANTPVVEPHFQPEHLLAGQNWDLFYLYNPEDLDEDPILFVLTAQLDAYLRLLNKKHKLALKIPDGGNDAKFFYRFGRLSTPKPRYLGRTTCVQSYRKLTSIMPLPDPEDDLEMVPEIQRDEFAAMIKQVKESWVGGKGKGKGRSKQNAMKRHNTHKGWGHATKRVQRFLGLRQKITSVNPANELVLDVNTPAPYTPEDDVVFICVDIETYERIPKLVTEVGFAILDTRDIRGVAPGKGAENWFPLIQGRHLRIKEYKQYRNRTYVRGCPEHFQYGVSEFVGIDGIEKTCVEILTPKDPATGKPRNVILVGHDIHQDTELLFVIDVDVHELVGLKEIVDNQKLQQHWAKLPNPQSLSNVLSGLEIPHAFLHNAGNDSVLTLQSLLALAVLKRQESLAREPGSEKE